MVIKATDNDNSSIVLGHEGQGWKRIALDVFVRSSIVVEPQVVSKASSQRLP
jgi:hypothetical protein